MKKIISLIVIISLLLIAFFIYFFVSNNGYYKTEEYYVLINDKPQIGYEKTDTGGKIKTYNYKVIGYNKGKSKHLDVQLREKLSINTSYLIKWEDRRDIVIDIKQIPIQKFNDNK
ncbi:DUF1093 domain-containing protein [Mammaliicoccus sciuri]|uniref:DUF1093 domain-containing protein n=1 Tax=Mammaliicoccus sciuri TaxID=1296 RepID=UPI001FB23AB2|nr:DUF1093 domain-containing protein [Mammaliicoccus sciuri]MCJ0941563.1 YxeA family protein [Mammaliicoccus sciuri]